MWPDIEFCVLVEQVVLVELVVLVGLVDVLVTVKTDKLQ